MSSYFTGKNIVIGVLIFIILLWVGFVGYSALNQKVNPVDPAAPEIIVNKDIFNIGDQIQVKVKHNRTLGKYNVNWQVLDGYSVKHDYISCAADSVIMGTGPVPKILLVICNINYVENGEIISYFLSSQVKIGNGPLPPPVPPEPKPPVPPNPPVPPVDPVVTAFQNAYNLDGKLKDKLIALTAVYRQSGLIVGNHDNKTPSAIFDVMRDSIATILQEPNKNNVTILKNLRIAIATELDKTLPIGPASTQELTADNRLTIATQFTRIQKILEGINP